MPITLGAGPSIKDYDRNELSNYAAWAFTFAVNHVAFDFPCDVIVSLDYGFLKENRDRLSKRDKVIVTREWDGNKELGLDLVEIPNAVGAKYKFSGMAAVKLADALTAKMDSEFPAYVLGIDGGKGRYKGHEGKGPSDYTTAIEDDYKALGLKNTANLSIRSTIKCWPKYSKLPHVRKIWCAPVLRAASIAWIRANAKEIL